MGRKCCGKGEIARYKQFLLFPLQFHKSCAADTYNSNQSLFGKGSILRYDIFPELQERCAKLFGMEATLFVPTGTMGNLISSKISVP